MPLRAAPALVFALLTAAVAWPQAGQWAEKWPEPALVRVEPGELAFKTRDYEAATSESVFLVSRFNGGWVLMASFFEFRTVLIHRWGIYISVTDPAGRDHWLKHEMDPSEVRSDPTRLFITDGKNTVECGPLSSRVAFDVPGFSCDLRVTNILPPWKGGDGIDRMSPDGKAFAVRVLACPWGEVTGTMKLDGRAVEVRGQGLLEKSLIVNPLNRLDPLLYSIRVYSPDEAPLDERWYVGILDVMTHEAYGSERLPRMEVGKAGAWLFTTRDYTLEPRDVRRSAGMPYPAPRRIGLTARGNGYLLEAEYRAEILFSVTDVLSEVPKWVRPIISVFMKRPVYLRFLGELVGTVTFADGHVESIRLYGPYEYVIAR